MVAISNLFTISATLAAAAFCVSAQKITAPGRPPKELAEVMDCQAHCIERPPIFGNKPDPKHTVSDFMKMHDPYHKMPFLVKNMQEIAKPCYANVTGMHTYTQLDSPTFEWYVNCNGQTLTRNENQYKVAGYDYKKNGFTDKEWKEFNDFTLKGFRRALHKCRGDCRKLHFPKTSAPSTPAATPNAKPNKGTPTAKPTVKPTATPTPKPKTPKAKAEVAPKPAAKPTKATKKPAKPTKATKKPAKPTKATKKPAKPAATKVKKPTKPTKKPTKPTKKPAPKPTKVTKKPTPKPTATQKALPKA